MSSEKLPPVCEPKVTRLTLQDGIELVADVYRPSGSGRHPVMLMRQPYGRQIASTITLAHPAWYAAQGYVVIVQDVRGRGESGGQFRLFEHEAADGAETMAWAADLPGSNGQVATYGFSYQASTQFLALAGALRAGTKRPDAIVPTMGAWDFRNDFAFPGGAFALSENIGWACQMGAEEARLKGDVEAYQAFAAAARSGAWSGPVAAKPDVLMRYFEYQHYPQWLSDDPGYWQKISPALLLAGRVLDVPGFHLGGWQDFFLDGTLGAHATFARGLATQRLVVGPWAHLPWGRRVGVLDLGPKAITDVDRATVAFLDNVLKGREAPGPAVKLFDIGTRSWVSFDSFPDAEPTSLFMTSDGLAATASTGRLLTRLERSGDDVLVHDPWRPMPVSGGPWGPACGYQDRTALDDRSDAAVYTTDPLTAPMRLAGRVALDVHVETSALSHDIHAVLSLVEPDGRAITLTAGHLRVTAPTVAGARRVAMRALCCTVRPGQRLRLSLQASAWPAFTINPGTGASAESARADEARVITLVIRHGAEHPSHLLLPVVA